MNRIVSLCFIILIFLSACATPAVSTSVPAEQASVPPSQPAEVIPVESTATVAAPEPTMTPTSVPPPARWYWSVDANSMNVIAVNQFGDRKEIGTLENADYDHTAAISLDKERALLFLDDNDTLRVYLLTPDAMRKIALPSEPFYFDTASWQPSRAVIATYEDHVLFSYVTDSNTNIMPDRGPIFLADLTTLTAKLIDESVSRGSNSDSRSWIHASQNGRYLRYMNGDQEKMDIRELDMATGEAHTLFSTTGSSFNIRSSPSGDVWYLRTQNSIVDLSGNQTDFTDESQTVRPLKDGRVAVYPRECVDTCVIKVIAPFGNVAELTYKFPWVIESASIYNTLDQVLPDQSLLVAGRPYAFLSNEPAAIRTYPDLLGEDSPLFRLTSDGQARLVGIHTGNVSDDGRYILLRASNQTSFFIYDALADRPLFDIPIDTELEDYFVSTRFLDMGILVSLSSSVPGEQNVYRFFYHAYVYEPPISIAWEDVNAEVSTCPDLLNDGTIICWFYHTDTFKSDLVRFDAANGAKTILLEDAWLIEYTP